jgi:prepilin-type N-terminal cleavage/methylation domain-containing protein
MGPVAFANPRGIVVAGSHVRRAYTLAEMLIVIVLVAIITALALPKANYMGFRIDAGVRSVRTALQRAQAGAVAGQHNMLLTVDAAHNRIAVISDNNNNLLADPGEQITYASLQDGVKLGVPSTTWPGAPAPTAVLTGSQLQTINSLPAFVFRADGAASSDAQISLTSVRGLATDQRGINVVQATGHVDTYKNTGSVWTRVGF